MNPDSKRPEDLDPEPDPALGAVAGGARAELPDVPIAPVSSGPEPRGGNGGGNGDDAHGCAGCGSESTTEDAENEAERPYVPKRALVIGGGIAGIQAALDLANARIRVTLVEKSASLGGRMAQLDKTFPTMDCSI
jgi:NADPH-dependent 2,4-dienoyl-CoA reductase/sulfur reductase-like enzyme